MREALLERTMAQAKRLRQAVRLRHRIVAERAGL